MQTQILSSSATLLDNENIDIDWRRDPKRVSPGTSHLTSSKEFQHSISASALIWTNDFYILINSKWEFHESFR